MDRTHLRTVAAMTILCLFSACQPPRSPQIRRPLEIEGKPKPKVEIKAAAGDLVRIGIRIDAKEVTISNLVSIRVSNLIEMKGESWPPGSYTLRAKGKKIILDGKEIGTKLRFSTEQEDKFIQCGNNSYRGYLVVRVSEPDTLIVVNELLIDDYLKGVLPREVVMTWHQQALRVQAVASRTYLASHLGSHSAQGFDLCSDVHCQVYGGTTKEHPNTNEAVDATHDQILVYDGKPIGAYFHSNCGGTTEQISYVWGQTDKPYLPRKKCEYGTADPRYKWSKSFSSEEILSALKAKAEVKGKKLKSLRIKKKSPSGRAEIITVVTDAGAFHLKGNTFRLALNPEKIRSTLFTDVSRHGDGYEFSGRGWGHGVGMCQWGAKGQAEHGRDYRDILAFYYPHAELAAWSR